MNNALLISVRLHDYRYHGTGDWPPAPARLFQALMAGAARGEKLSDAARDALGWLEGLSAPEIAAPRSRDGRSFVNFVPNNALDAIQGDVHKIGMIRTTKTIKPRFFEPEVPFLYLWRFAAHEDNTRHAQVVCAIADSLYQLGRGIDMAWGWGEVLEESEAEVRLEAHGGSQYHPTTSGNGTALDCPMPGSLVSLQNRYQGQGQRFTVRVENKVVLITFTQAPKPRFKSVAYNSQSSLKLFDIRESSPNALLASWSQVNTGALVLHLRDAAVKRLRDALPTKLADIERVLIGHDATDTDKAARVRIVPLPSIGHHYTERSIRRVLIEVPPNCPIDADDLTWAFSGIVVNPGDVDTRTGEILHEETRLVPAAEHSMLAHYGINDDQNYRKWRTVTPAALPERAARRRIDPRRLRDEAKPGSERAREQYTAATAVLQALRHARITTPVSSIRVQREPFAARGARAEAFAERTRFAKERLWHVEITFTEPVSGPLLLGDGRYMGLGLMAPAHRVEDIHCFVIVDGLTSQADATVISQALRRAVMSRVQDAIGKRGKLPNFFTGHEPNGAPSRSGIHAHLAFAADLARHRLLIIAPHLLEGRQPTHAERENLKMLESSVADFHDLRAGSAGRLMLSRTEIDVHDDPLFSSARRWESVTDYKPTRYAKRTPSEALVSDIRLELSRRGLAIPTQIEVIHLHEGPKGGLAGRLRLHFATFVKGPILIGHTRHTGGGLFQRLSE